MRRAGVMSVLAACVGAALLAAPPASLWAEEPVQAAANEQTDANEQTVTGRLIASWCVLNEGSLCLSKNYKSAARNCVRMGSPMALLVGDEKKEQKELEVYHLSTLPPALKLQMANWMNAQVTVRGKITVRNGQRHVVVSHAQRADRAAKPIARASTL